MFHMDHKEFLIDWNCIDLKMVGGTLRKWTPIKRTSLIFIFKIIGLWNWITVMRDTVPRQKIWTEKIDTLLGFRATKYIIMITDCISQKVWLSTTPLFRYHLGWKNTQKLSFLFFKDCPHNSFHYCCPIECRY